MSDGVLKRYAGSGIFWLLYILVVVTSLLPAFAVKSFFSMYRPLDSQIAREIEKNIKKKRAVELTSVASVSHLVQRPNPNNDSDDPFA